jgi:hypothetical protein
MVMGWVWAWFAVCGYVGQGVIDCGCVLHNPQVTGIWIIWRPATAATAAAAAGDGLDGSCSSRLRYDLQAATPGVTLCIGLQPHLLSWLLLQLWLLL